MPDPLIEAIKARVSQPGRRTMMEEQFRKTTIVYPVVTLEQIQTAEAQLGFRLPDFMRALYLEVGNGGYGPAYGIVGLEGGHEVLGKNLVQNCLPYHDLERIMNEIGEPLTGVSWGNQFIVYCDWGCGSTTVLDCADPAIPVYAYAEGDVSLHSSKMLRQWWQDWLDGTIKQY